MTQGGTWDPNQTPDQAPTFQDFISALYQPDQLNALAAALGGGLFPGVGLSANDTMPMVDSVAPGFPLNLPFVVAANQVKLQSVKLSFQPQAFRTYYSSTLHTHGGDQVGNENAHNHGGDTIQTLSISINAGTGHRHKILTASSGPPSSSNNPFNYLNGSGTSHLVGLNSDTLEDIWSAADSDAVGSPTGSAHGHNNTAHTHSPGTTGVGSAHAHAPGTTGANNPATGVQEGTSPDSMHVFVDGTDVTTQLGGPFSAAVTELDITPYVSPAKGLHNVQVSTSNNLGRIAGFVRHKSIENQLSPGA